jgi:prepilin-type N-terminal cleavage/methylation domain-containing protein
MKKKGFTLIELLVVISIIAMLLAILMPALSKVKKIAARVVCGTNLKGLGTAQAVYAHDYNDQYAVQGRGGAHTWSSKTADWFNTNKIWANASTITVGASLYLLVREADVSPKSFVCPSGGETVWDGKTGAPGAVQPDITQVWDFGGNTAAEGNQGPANVVSYSYHQPYIAGDTTQAGSTGRKNRFAADGMRSASFAIMADRSPFFDSKLALVATATQTDFIDKASFLNLGTSVTDWAAIEKWRIQIANSQPHDRDGQNVMYADGHNSYENRSDVGTKNDNIYTPWTITTGGSLPTNTEAAWRIGGSVATANLAYGRGSEDSVLVNDGRN